MNAARVGACLAPGRRRRPLAVQAARDVCARRGEGLSICGGPPACPRCGRLDTELISAFGSTACKALHRCRTCRDPFDAFKCH